MEVARTRGRKGGRKSVATLGVLQRARDMLEKGLTLKIGKTALYSALQAEAEDEGEGAAS
jgi:hypothetical protein